MKRFLKTVGLLFLATVGLSALLLAAAYAAGTVWVSVQEKSPGGHHIVVAIPAVLVPLGLDLAPQEKLREVSNQARPWLPAMHSASVVLERCPDARLVEVRSHSEVVEVLKRSDTLIIDVDSPQEHVHVSFPIRMVQSVVQRLESVRDSA
jgi:invasion protein IalB